MAPSDRQFTVTEEDIDMARFVIEAAEASGASTARRAVLAGDLERLLAAKERESTLRWGLRAPLTRPVYPAAPENPGSAGGR
jgi:hypothetical protein